MLVQTLHNETATRAFYEERYRSGYMDHWDRDKRAVVAELLAGLELPAGARILDFGCGTGVFTELICQVYPGAEVHGCDPSQAALRQASARKKPIRCFTLNEENVERHAGSFDVVFTHHVLEHVFDLATTSGQIDAMLKFGGRMLHILPCGNEGSLHHRICGFYQDGIERDVGNRFFFEDRGHLRRLTTAELAEAFAVHGFRIERAVYAGHFWGAIRFITEGSPRDITELLDPGRARAGSRHQVIAWLVAMMVLFAARAPVLALSRIRHLLRRFCSRTRQVTSGRLLLILCILPVALPLWLPSMIVDRVIRWLARREWRIHQDRPNGAEMMVVLQRP
jgi:SAM-dependent methyltransferase